MKILADVNILFAKEAFGQFGEVITVEGRDITRERLKDIDALLVRSVTPVNRDLLDGTSVKFVASATTGTDHVDLAYLRDSHRGFAHAPGSNANSVAEYVVAALLYCAEKRDTKLEGKTLGIVGVGDVGTRVLYLGRALGMRCLLNDPPKKALSGSDLYLPLTAVLKESDVVTIHVPLTMKGPDATYRMVSAEFISSMKEGSFFVNTSRGDVLHEPSLISARKRLGCVVLDVWNNEPEPDPGTIAVCDLATPHIAGYSYDGKVSGTEMIYDAACAFFSHQRKWRPPSACDDDQPKQIALNDEVDPLAKAVLKAYPILKDDSLFRKIVLLDASRRGEYFGAVRSNYSRRLEFKNYAVAVGRKIPDSVKAALANLGFAVTTEQIG
jgi:erythronate-4-phosphate dehydrogenase